MKEKNAIKYIIETERLILRPFMLSDASDLFEFLKELESRCFYSMKLSNLEEAQKDIKKKMKDRYCFAISLKENNKVIGEIEAINSDGEPEYSFNNPNDTFSPCWMLNKKYQSKGYAYEAAKAFISFLFNECNARRIYAYVDDYNVRSQHLCEKLGMRKEGLFKELIAFTCDKDGNPIYENTYQFAILKKEWEEQNN